MQSLNLPQLITLKIFVIVKFWLHICPKFSNENAYLHFNLHVVKFSFTGHLSLSKVWCRLKHLPKIVQQLLDLYETLVCYLLQTND